MDASSNKADTHACIAPGGDTKMTGEQRSGGCAPLVGDEEESQHEVSPLTPGSVSPHSGQQTAQYVQYHLPSHIHLAPTSFPFLHHSTTTT